MAREFSKSEIIRQKCSICGIKNKKFTELLYDNKMSGYRLTCCNCGHVDTFYKDDSFSDTIKFDKGREVCIQVTTCKYKTCPYYQKYNLQHASFLLGRILNGLDTSCITNGDGTCTSCTCENCPNYNPNNPNTESNSSIKISDSYKLDINGYRNNNPKFH